MLEGAETLLAQARLAWRIKQQSLATVRRLGKYRRLTSGMKYDRDTALQRIEDSERTLARILGAIDGTQNVSPDP